MPAVGMGRGDRAGSGGEGKLVWSRGCVSTSDSRGRTIWIADAGGRCRAGLNQTFAAVNTHGKIGQSAPKDL
jgi:hypothetical protein